MPDEENSSKLKGLPGWATTLLDLPWIEMAGELWKISRKVMRGLSNEGMLSADELNGGI
jgi:hypothetical protein